MPTIFTHGFVGLAAGKIFFKKEKPKFWILSVLLPVLPDLDVVAFSFGISYGSTLGHRGFSHSIIFALLAALFVMFIFFREIRFFEKARLKYFVWFFLITLSHPLLDALTNGGLGVGLFIPFYSERYFLPFRPIAVSPISIKRFLDGTAFYVLTSEFLWVWLPLIFTYFLKTISERFLQTKKAG